MLIAFNICCTRARRARQALVVSSIASQAAGKVSIPRRHPIIYLSTVTRMSHGRVDEKEAESDINRILIADPPY